MSTKKGVDMAQPKHTASSLSRFKPKLWTIAPALFLCFILLAYFVSSATTPAITAPSQGSNISGTYTINFTFTGTVNYTLTYTNGTGTYLINASNNTPEGDILYDWDTSSLPDMSINITLNTTNSSDANDNNFDFLSSINIDNTAPIIALDLPQDGNSSTSENIFFNWTISDRDTNANCTLFIDGVSNLTFLAAETSNTTLNMLNGNYDWNISCIDNAGNTGNSTINNFDVATPFNPRFIYPGNNSNLSGTVIINVTWGSVATSYFIHYQENSAGFTVICGDSGKTGPQTCAFDTTTPGINDNNNYTLRLRANNGTDTDIFLYNITIDNTPPNLTLNLPANNSQLNSPSVNFNWTVSDAVDTNTNCTFILDDTINNSFGASTNNTTLALADGAHTWQVNCSDYTGNYNTSNVRNLTIDTAFPLFIEANITPTSAENLTNASPVLSVAFTEGNPDTCEYYNGSGWTTLSTNVAGGVTLCTGQVNTQVNGAQLNFSFRLNDTAGNTNTTANIINLTVDAIAPVLTINSPVSNYDISDGSTFFVNVSVSEANMTDGENCSLYIDDDENNLTGVLNYNASTSECVGNVTLKSPSGLDPGTINFEFKVIVKDAVNNSGENTSILQIDNLPPSIIGKTTNYTNNATTNISNNVTITITLSDHSNISSVRVGNTSIINLTNTTPTGDVFAAITTGAALGCLGTGPCSLRIYTNDTWGLLNDSESLLYIIDGDSPYYSNLAINTTGPIELKEPALISAEWTDQSLTSSQSTIAQLYKYNDARTSASVIESVLLNDTNTWSNFTYLPNVSDEGEILFFYINYTDFASRSNVTTNLSVSVTNTTPIIYTINVTSKIGNISNESPVFSLEFSDTGKAIGSADRLLQIDGAGGSTNFSISSCSSPSTYQTLGALDEVINAAVSSRSPYNDSFLITTINYTNSTNDYVTLERINYAKANSSTLYETTSNNREYNDWRIVLNNVINDSGTIKANLTFTDLMYTEYYCNKTLTQLSEGTYNATLFVTDGANNTNSSLTSWLVDGFRPIFINFSVGDQWIIRDGVRLTNTTNISLNDVSLTINWTLNETNMNSTNISIDKQIVYSVSSSATNGSAVVSIEPGFHFVQILASDIIQSTTSATTNANTTIVLNGVTNFSRIYDDLSTSLTTNLNTILSTSLQNMTWYLSGLNINENESTRLNDSVSLFMSFNVSDATWNVSTSGVNGLLFNWNNTGWNLSITNTSTTFASATGITPTYVVSLASYEKYSWTNNDIDTHSYFPSSQPSQATNWSFNASNESLIVLEDIEDGNAQYHLLSACSATPSSVTSFSEACYDQNDTQFIVYSPAFVGVAFGSDAGAPNVTIETPAVNQTINNSQFLLNFSVIEPRPNETMFCNYSFMQDNASIGSESLVPANFSLAGMKYYYTKNYYGLYDDNDYSVNVTCWDAGGLSASAQRTFTLTDITDPIINITGESSTPYSVTINVSSNEWTKFRLNYSTSSDTQLSTRTNSSTYDFNDSITLTSLEQDSRVYYRVYACDLADNCVYYPSGGGSGYVYTTEVTGRQSSGGGGGGGGMVEGMVVATHFHGWSELPAGPFTYGINDESIAVKDIELVLDEKAVDPTIQIQAYYGKANSVPRAQPIAYQYFRIIHTGFEEVTSKWALRFAIPTEWLENRSSDTEKVHLFRFEQGNWSEYPVKYERRAQDDEYFTVDVPGFSFFVITADGVEPVTGVSSENNVSDGTISGPGGTTQEPDTNAGNGDAGDSDNAGGSGAGGGDVVTYDDGGFNLWLIVISLLAIIALGFGGAYYVRTQQERQRKSLEFEALDPNDPLYELQEYIMRALLHNHSPEQIKHNLLGAGWDDIIIEEEIEKALMRRVDD